MGATDLAVLDLYGPVVNLAFRLEAMTKAFGVGAIVTREVADAALRMLDVDALGLDVMDRSLLLERPRVEREPGGGRQSVEQRGRRPGVGHGRDVVRHLGPEADGGDAPAMEGMLENGGHPTRNVRRVPQERHRFRQLDRRSRARQPGGPGVGHGERVCAEPHHHAGTEIDGDVRDQLGEELPVGIGLETAE